MQKILRRALIGAIMTGSSVLCGLEANAVAAEAPTANASLGVYSQYIWRGYALSKDSLVLQPSLTAGYRGFAANLWGNLDTDQYGKESEAFNWNETDMTLSYSGSAGIVNYCAGYIYYDVEGIQDTAEVYAGLSLATLLTPSVTYYQDIANVPGWYATFGVSHSFALKDAVSLDVSGRIGYLDDTKDHSEFHDAVVALALPWKLTDKFSVAPQVAVSFALSDGAEELLTAANRAAIGEDESSFVYGGVLASLSF